MPETSTAASPPASAALIQFAPLLVILGIFYLLVWRPQIKKQKAHAQMLANLKKGDRILTGGGLYATVLALRGEIVEAKISENTKVEILKSSITQVLSQENKPQGGVVG